MSQVSNAPRCVLSYNAGWRKEETDDFPDSSLCHYLDDPDDGCRLQSSPTGRCVHLAYAGAADGKPSAGSPGGHGGSDTHPPNPHCHASANGDAHSSPDQHPHSQADGNANGHTGCHPRGDAIAGANRGISSGDIHAGRLQPGF